AADVDDVGARLVELDAVRDGPIRVQIPPAVGEGVAGHVDHAHHHAAAAPTRADRDGAHLRRMRSSASAREAALVCNSPRTAEVVVLAPGLRMPRIAMHRCSASTTTIAPRGSSLRMTASAIWLVSRSCTCGRLA